MKEQEHISPYYITKQVTLELLNKLFWLRFTIFTGLRCFRLEAAFSNPSQFFGMF